MDPHDAPRGRTGGCSNPNPDPDPNPDPNPNPDPIPNLNPNLYPNPDQVNLRLLAARNEPAYFGNTLWCSYSVGDFQPCGYGFGPLQAAGARHTECALLPHGKAAIGPFPYTAGLMCATQQASNPGPAGRAPGRQACYAIQHLLEIGRCCMR